jgi:hypothetical protein
MLNGQLKPAYNLQHAVDAQYITWLDFQRLFRGVAFFKCDSPFIY